MEIQRIPRIIQKSTKSELGFELQFEFSTQPPWTAERDEALAFWGKSEVPENKEMLSFQIVSGPDLPKVGRGHTCWANENPGKICQIIRKLGEP